MISSPIYGAKKGGRTDGLILELQSPRTKAQYVANAVVYYNEHFGQEPQPLNASVIREWAISRPSW